jgi:Mce-associated membrane protein
VTPTWYDLLGVEPDATTEEIRAAWKSAIADLEPGERRFRTLNEAAEVLLDPARRAAYDRELDPDPPTGRLRPRGAGRGRAGTGGPAETQTPPQEERAETRVETDSPTTARTVPGWLLAGLAVLVALLLACAGYLLTQPSDDQVSEGTGRAQAAAERAVTTILAYDFRHLDEDQKAADELMTADYRKKYDPLFAQIAANAPDLKAVVTCEVVASGIVRSGEDRVQVQVFVNRPTLRKDLTEPEVFRDQVVLTMERSGDHWLVDGMDTNNLAG